MSFHHIQSLQNNTQLNTASQIKKRKKEKKKKEGDKKKNGQWAAVCPYYLSATHGAGSWGFPQLVWALSSSNFPQGLGEGVASERCTRVGRRHDMYEPFGCLLSRALLFTALLARPPARPPVSQTLEAFVLNRRRRTLQSFEFQWRLVCVSPVPLPPPSHSHVDPTHNGNF